MVVFSCTPFPKISIRIVISYVIKWDIHFQFDRVNQNWDKSMIRTSQWRESHSRLWNPTFQYTSLLRLVIIRLQESPKSTTTCVKQNCASLCNFVKELITKTWFINKHRNTHKTVFLCLFQLEKVKTNRAYVHKSWYAKHGLGYCNIVYYRWQSYDHRNPTKKHYL